MVNFSIFNFNYDRGSPLCKGTQALADHIQVGGMVVWEDCTKVVKMVSFTRSIAHGAFELRYKKPIPKSVLSKTKYILQVAWL